MEERAKAKLRNVEYIEAKRDIRSTFKDESLATLEKAVVNVS